jgi:hypothetical protein
MNQTTLPLYPKATLFKAMSIALIVATVIFVTVILPAETGDDPSGVGKSLGLDSLNQASEVTPAVEPPTAPEAAVQPMPMLMGGESVAAQYAQRSDTTTVIVPAKKGIEYKFRLRQFDELTFEWSVDHGALYFDFHGEPKGDTTGYFKSYSVTTASTVKGAMTVPFEGIHGWFWRNTSDKPITVTLETSGKYEVVEMD